MTLKERKRLILLSLIIKGVLFYGTILAVGISIAVADSMPVPLIIGIVLILGSLIFFLNRNISSSDFKRITFMSRQERKEFDSETV